jgi:hypothetical protein
MIRNAVALSAIPSRRLDLAARIALIARTAPSHAEATDAVRDALDAILT